MNKMIAAVTIRRPAVLSATLLVLSSVVSVGTMPAQVPSPTDPHGVQVRVTAQKRPLSGELLAVGTDSLWLLQDGRTVALGKSEISFFSYRKHKFNGRKALAIGGAVSGLTTAALAIACSNYNNDPNEGDVQCGTTTASWLGGTGVLALLTAGWASVRQWTSVPLSRWEEFNIYARFPQGVPASYSTSTAVPAGK